MLKLRPSYKNSNNNRAPEIISFGMTSAGEMVSQFILRNQQGMTVKLINYGAAIASVTVPSAAGIDTELTLGFDTLKEYEAHPFYFGCIAGRVANRISGGKFLLNNKIITLDCNENIFSHLHGGRKGFDKVVWNANVIEAENISGIEFSYLSKNGEENYPGNLLVKAIYFLTDDNELKIKFHAETDQATPVNLTNHTYWNLAGKGNILGHELQIFSDKYLITDENHLPTGEIKSVSGTLFDFRSPRTIDVGGFDHYYTTGAGDKKIALAARVTDRFSGRILETYTTQPGLQFYSGNYLDDYPIANGERIQQWGGLCLEAQGYPDAVNQPHFPAIILNAEEIYAHETIYKIIL